MATVAYLIKNYLPLSEPFIYNQLINLTGYQAVVSTEKILNRELFPFENIWCEEDLPPLKRFFSRMNYALSGNYPPLIKYLKDNQVNVLHAHFGFMGIDMLSLARQLRLPLLTTFYGVDISALPRVWSYRMRLEKLWDRGDGFIVLSEKMKQLALELGAPAAKIHIVRIGVNISACFFHPREVEPPFKFFMCGRLVEKKGFEYGIRAFAKVCKGRNDLFLHILGDGVQRPQLEALVKELEIDSQVHFLGYRSHAEYLDYLHASDVFLAPSVTAATGDSEGTPTVLMEAQATGMPVISSQHAAIDEVVLNKVSGYLVPEKDVDAIAERMAHLIEHPEIWGEMGEKGRAHVERHYNSVTQGKKLSEIYESVIKI